LRKQTGIIEAVKPVQPRSLLPVLSVALIVASLLFLACGSGDEPAAPTSDGSPAHSDVDVPQGERRFLLDTRGVFELTDTERTLLFARPDRSFLYDFAVSPDGERLALAIQDEPTQTAAGYDFGVDLFVTQGDGEDLIELAVHERIGEVMSRPVWLPNGEDLVFAVLGRTEGGGADIRIERVSIETRERVRLIDNAMEPALSPDATRLAYVLFDPQTGFERLKLYDLETGESSPLLEDKLMYNVANLAWSPDGSRLVFAAADPPLAPGAGMSASLLHPELRDIWVIDADGGNLRRVLELADAMLSMAWAEDGAHVYAVGDTGFWRVNVDAGTFTRLGDAVLGGRVQTLLPQRD
jgi:Tol biopolymer transport system component